MLIWAPPPVPISWSLEVLGDPVVSFAVLGTPGPQGSKKHVGGGRMVESSKKVKPWRKAVYEAARDHTGGIDGFEALDGPLVADMVFTLEKGTTLPKYLDWHFRVPDLSKLARSTEDAVKGVVWTDDARVSDYRRLSKRWVGSDDPDALDEPGAVIRVWPVPTHLIEARRAAARRPARSLSEGTA